MNYSVKLIKPIAIMLHTAINVRPTTGVLLVAPPSSGKSALIRQIKGKGVYFVDDITSGGIDSLINEYTDARVIAVSDLAKIVKRRNETSPLYALLNLTEEGYTGTTRYKNVKANEKRYITFVAGITTEYFKKYLKEFEDTGLLSRMYLIHYKYTPQEMEKILKEVHETGIDLSKYDMGIEYKDSITLKEYNKQASKIVKEKIIPHFTDNESGVRKFKRFDNFVRTFSALYSQNEYITPKELAYASALIATYSRPTRAGTFEEFKSTLKYFLDLYDVEVIL